MSAPHGFLDYIFAIPWVIFLFMFNRITHRNIVGWEYGKTLHWLYVNGTEGKLTKLILGLESSSEANK